MARAMGGGGGGGRDQVQKHIMSLMIEALFSLLGVSDEEGER